MSGDNKELYDKLSELIREANKNQTIELKKEIQVEVSGIKREITEIKKLIAEETGKRHQLEEKQLSLENKQEHIEQIIKKNNVLIFGLKYDNSENLAEFTISKLNSLLEQNLTVASINNVFQLGKGEGNRPILVKFLSFLTKIQILRNCKKLKGTGISISDDLTREEREIRKILIKHKKLAQTKGYNAYIKNNKLHINEEIYTHKDLEESQTGIINRETESAGSSGNRKCNSAPITPARIINNETDSEVDDDEVSVEDETESEDEEEDGRKEINIKKSERLNSNNQASYTRRAKGKSPNSNSNIKKRKSEATHVIGPVTRRFKRNQKKPSPKNKPNSNKEPQKLISIVSEP